MCLKMKFSKCIQCNVKKLPERVGKQKRRKKIETKKRE